MLTSLPLRVYCENISKLYNIEVLNTNTLIFLPQFKGSVFWPYLAWGGKCGELLGSPKTSLSWVCHLAAFFVVVFRPKACGYFDSLSPEEKMHTLEIYSRNYS